jgi:hypothetical protein
MVCMAAPAVASPAPVPDYATIARDIIPAGEYGSVPTPATLPAIEQQAQMYNALTPLWNNVTPADLNADFKPEPVNVGDAPGPISRETVPRSPTPEQRSWTPPSRYSRGLGRRRCWDPGSKRSWRRS